jgi:hypothetical protein
VYDGGAIKAGSRERLVEGCRDVRGAHRRSEFPGHDVSREVVEDGRQIVPTPTSDLEVGEVGLPELVDGGGLVLELVRRLDHHIGGAGDEVVRLQQPIDRSFRDEVLPLVGEPNGQFARRQLRQLQRQVDDLAADVVGNTVPDPIWPRSVIGQCLRPPDNDRTSDRT